MRMHLKHLLCHSLTHSLSDSLRKMEIKPQSSKIGLSLDQHPACFIEIHFCIRFMLLFFSKTSIFHNSWNILKYGRISNENVEMWYCKYLNYFFKLPINLTFCQHAQLRQIYLNLVTFILICVHNQIYWTVFGWHWI